MRTVETSKKNRVQEWYATIPRKKKRLLFVAATIIPLFIWLSIYFLIPIITMVIYSFTNAHMAYDTYKFVGLDNYIRLFSDPMYLVAIKNSFICVACIVPAAVILSVLTAVGLNAMTDRLREFFTFAYFMPSLLSMTAICLVWRWLYNPAYGLINAILNFIGIESQQFIQSSSQALYSLCVIQVWSIFGYYAVIILTAIRGVDKSIYEAAEIDGANSVQRFLHVTLPLIKNSILFVTVMVTNSAFMFFTPIKLLTKGGPGTSTTTLLLYVMRNGIEQSNLGLGSAGSMVLMAMILCVSGIQFLLTHEKKPKPIKVNRKSDLAKKGAN